MLVKSPQCSRKSLINNRKIVGNIYPLILNQKTTAMAINYRAFEKRKKFVLCRLPRTIDVVSIAMVRAVYVSRCRPIVRKRYSKEGAVLGYSPDSLHIVYGSQLSMYVL